MDLDLLLNLFDAEHTDISPFFLADGDLNLIRLGGIIQVTPRRDGTTLHLIDGRALEVTEPLIEVAERLNDAAWSRARMASAA